MKNKPYTLVLVTLGLLAAPLLLSATINYWPKENSCPTKGWASDSCVNFGEFRYGPKTILIPNKEPNKFRWQGRLTYYSDRKELSSPNLGFYWRTGQAAGRADERWPLAKADLINFSLSYSENDPTQTKPLSQHWRPPIRSNATPELPFPIPTGLYLYTDNDDDPAFSANDALMFLDAKKTIFFSCPSVIETTNKHVKGYTWCRGTYYPQPGLRVSFSITTISLQSWQQAVGALSTLINSWSAKNAVS